MRFAIAIGIAATLLVGAFAVAPALAEDEEKAAPTKTVKMTVENFKWVPNKLRVAKGTELELHIRSYDATHRFDLKKPYNLKVLLPQGDTTLVKFTASHVGTFKWKCGRPCGDGCPKMTGKLTVVEPQQNVSESD